MARGKSRLKTARLKNLLRASLFSRRLRLYGVNPYRLEDTCLICRRRVSPEALAHDELSQYLNPGMSAWKMCLANSICDVLEIEDKIVCGRWFQKAVYCIRCTTLICDAEFLLKSIKTFESKLDAVREETHNLLMRNVGDIIRRDSLGEDQPTGVTAGYDRAIREVTANLTGSSTKEYGDFIPEMSPVSIENEEKESLLSLPFSLGVGEERDPLAMQMETQPLHSSNTFVGLKKRLPIERERHLRRLKMRKRKQLKLSDPPCRTSFSDTTWRSKHKCSQLGSSHNDSDNDSAPSVSDPVKLINCNLCNLQFNEESLFRRHLIRAHSVKVDKKQTLRCRVCPYPHWCVNQKALEEHMRLLHLDNPFRVKCSTCTVFCSTMQALDTHESLHTAKATALTPFACVFCDEEFCASVLLKHHAVEAHQAYLYCKEADCAFKTTSETRLEQHMWSHKFPSGKDPHKCKECPFETRYSADLKRHERKQHGKKVKCPREGCMEEFRYPDMLKRHINKVHDNITLPRKEVPCEICFRKFRDMWHMRNHMERHGDKRRYLCHLCPHAFKTASTLSNHLHTHKLKPPGASMNHSKPRRGRLSSIPITRQGAGENSNVGASCSDPPNESKLASIPE